jgi:hypothetical protein
LLFEGFTLFDRIAEDSDTFVVPVLDINEGGIIEAEDRFRPFRATVISPPVGPADFIGVVLEEDANRRSLELTANVSWFVFM